MSCVGVTTKHFADVRSSSLYVPPQSDEKCLTGAHPFPLQQYAMSGHTLYLHQALANVSGTDHTVRIIIATIIGIPIVFIFAVYGYAVRPTVDLEFDDDFAAAVTVRSRSCNLAMAIKG